MSPERIQVLQLVGVDDTNTVAVTKLTAGSSRLEYLCNGNVDLFGLLDTERFEIRTLLCGGIPSEPMKRPPIDVVVNAICDADTNTAALRNARRVVTRLGVPVVNHPSYVGATTRDAVARAIEGIPGVRVPRTARLTPAYRSEVLELAALAGVTPPFLVRPAGSHGGLGLLRIDGPDDERVLDRYAFDGRAFYVTEFVDTAWSDGLGRKRRAVVIDGTAFPRHHIVAEGWMIHARDRDGMALRPAWMEEERRWATEPLAEAPALEAMHRRIGLDYFGIDYAPMEDGSLVVFEVNACFRVLAVGSTTTRATYLQGAVDAIRSAMEDLVARRATQAAPPAP